MTSATRKLKRITYSPRLQPVLRLLVSTGEEDRKVLDDWIEEQPWNVAQDLWLATNPTPFQRKITTIAIGKGTSIAQLKAVMVGDEDDAPHVLAEARRQLLIHHHAKWVRLIHQYAQTGPKGDEVVLDMHGRPMHELADKVVVCLHLRARCNVPGCVIFSTGTHMLPPEPDLEAEEQRW